MLRIKFNAYFHNQNFISHNSMIAGQNRWAFWLIRGIHKMLNGKFKIWGTLPLIVLYRYSYTQKLTGATLFSISLRIL